MSIFSKIENSEHTFAAWAEKQLEKLYSEAPKLEAIADAVLKYCGPALQIIATAEGGAAAGTMVSTVIADAQTSLVAASGLIADAGATPAAASIVSSVKTNLSSLLTASHVTNPASVSLVTKVVSSLSALGSALTAASSTPAAAAPAA